MLAAERAPSRSAALEEALAAVERRKPGAHEFRDLSLWGRLYTTPTLHRLLPAVLAVPLARLWGRARWRLDPIERRTALDWAAYALGPDAETTEIERLARSAVMEVFAKRELTLRPWLARRTPLEGAEHLESVRAREGGAVIVSGHLGDLAGVPHVLAEHGYKLYSIASRTMLAGTVVRGWVGRVSALQYRYMEHRDSRAVPTGNAYRLVDALLRRGELCGIAFDVPGRVETTFMGRRMRLGGTAAALAFDTGSPVVPVSCLRRGHRRAVTVLEPVDPAAFPDQEALHEHLAGVISRMTLDHLEQYYPKRPENPPRPQPSTSAAGIAALLEALPPRDRALWETAIALGLRTDELRALDRRDVDLEHRRVRIARRWALGTDAGGLRDLASPRELALPAGLAERLGGAIRRRGLVFGRSARQPFAPVRVERRAARAWAAAGLAPIRLGTCRDIFAARRVEEGAGAEHLAAAMGKSVEAIRERYGHLLAPEVREPVPADGASRTRAGTAR